MLLSTNLRPSIISIFPEFESPIYLRNPETKKFWFQASNICNVLGFVNIQSALGLHCDEDEKYQQIWHGRATWFISESGCYGLAMGAKNDVAQKFKRWVKHEILPFSTEVSELVNKIHSTWN